MSSHRDAEKKKKPFFGAKNPVMIFNLIVQCDRSRALCRDLRSRISVSMVGKVLASPRGSQLCMFLHVS